MTAATDYLLRVGSSTLFTGFVLWIILFIVAMFRDPKGSEIIAWSINTQWAATGRILVRAAGFRFWGRLAMGIVALGIGCLVLGGVLTVAGLFLNRAKG